jgi:hypothetical protein
VPDPPTAAFHEISLHDTAPTLEFSFGGTDSKKDTGTGAFGGWGKTFDFGSIGTGTTADNKEEKPPKAEKGKEVRDPSTEFGDNNPWSSGNKSKTKKKTTMTNGFDFGDFGASQDTTDIDLEATGGIDTKPTEEDTWGFSAVNKKEKKKKGKDAAEEKKEESVTALPHLEKEKEADESWGVWGGNKKDKKKTKKGAAEEEIGVPPSDPVDASAEGGDGWGSFGFGKKDKKKGAKGATEDHASEKKAELQAAEPESTFDWSASTSKRDKKNKKKGLINEVDEDPIVAIEDAATGDITAAATDDWMNSAWTTGTKKKDQKGGKGVVEESIYASESITAVDTNTTTSNTVTGDDDWGFGTTKSKKDKKGKKVEAKASETPPVPPPPPAPEIVEEDDTWGDFSKKIKKGGKKGDSKVSDIPYVPPPPHPPPAVEIMDEDNSWSAFGKKDKKSGKKGKATNSDPIVPDPVIPDPVISDPEPLKEVEETKDESTWGTWGLSSKDKKKKEKDPKKKGTAEVVAEIPVIPAEEEEAPAQNDIWGSWGTTTKKKTGKKGKDEPPPPAPTPPAQGLTPEPGPEVLPELEDDGWGELTATKTKSSTKKGTLSRSTTLTGKTMKSDDAKAKPKDVKAEESEPIASPKDEIPSLKKDAAKEATPAKAAKSMWGSFGGATSSTAKSKLAKEKEKKAEEEKAKKEEEERVRMEEEQRAKEEAEAAAFEEALREQAEEPKKSSKSKTTGKVSKAEAKAMEKAADKKKAEEAALIDILDEPSPKEEKSTSKLKQSNAKTASDKVDKEAEKKEEKKSDDYFGFWGSSKKTTGKKDGETKKEIDNQGWANQINALADFPNDLEGTVADEPTPTAKSSKTMSATATKNKGTVTSSVAARIKALEANKKEEKAEKLKAEAQLAKDLSAATFAEESPREEKKKDSVSKSKTSSASTSKPVKKKELSPLAEEKKAKETFPGSFPGAFGDDDDLMALDDFPTAPEKKSVKKAKDDKKATAKSKPVKMDDLLVEAPEPPKLPTPPPEEKKPVKKERARVERTGTGSSWGFWGAAPTPTPKKDSTKKEPTRSVEEEEEVSPPPKKKSATAAGLSRSKSTKSPKEKGREDNKEAEKVSKSSGSDSKDKRPEARPSKSNRGMSFSAFMMGGPPPSATKAKPTRRSSVAGASRSTSRRQSMDVDAGGLMSPPPDDQPQISDKAAKLMGVKGEKLDRMKSSKGKQRASGMLSLPEKQDIVADQPLEVVPDPYPIDDDDMVMVNGLEDPLLNGTSSKNPPKEKLSKNKSKREVRKTSESIFPSLLRPSWEPEFTKEVQADGQVSYKQSKPSKPRARTLSNDDDVVMVEAGPSGGEPFVTSGPDDMAFVEHSAPEVKRSNTAAKKSGGFFGGFFGGGGKAERAPEPAVRSRPTSSYRDERMIDVEPLPTRAKDKSKRRSVKPTPADVEILDQAEIDPEAEARRADRRSAREAEELERAERRKSRREKEKAELEARRSKARDRARREQEAEEQRREDKRARRAAREEARAKEEADVEAAAAARRDERRRLRAELEASELEKARIAAEGPDGVDKIRKSAKEDRRKQFEREEEERLRRREEKKGGRSSRDKDKSGNSGKRKSTTSPLMDEYFESRNGNNTPKNPGGPTDKTSSWVKSQASDPPDLPPVEGTILDGENPRSAGLDDDGFDEGRGEERRRSSKKDSSSRRQSKYADPEDRRSSRRKESRRNAPAEEAGIRSGSGSGGDGGAAVYGKHRSSRRRDPALQGEYDAYADGGPAGVGIRTFDGRPANNGKRNSILGRLGGFL